MAFTPEEQQIIDWGTKNGKSVQDIKSAVFRYRTTGSPRDPSAPVEQPSVGSEYIKGVGQAFQGALDYTKQGIDTAQGPSIGDAALGGTQAGAGLLGMIGSVVAPLFKPVADGFKALTDKIGGTQFMQEAAAGVPEGGALEKSLQFASDLGTITGAAAGAKGTVTGVQKLASGISNGAEHLAGIADTGATGIKQAATKGLDSANIMQRVARISKGKQAAFYDLAGESEGQYLVKRGIFGDVNEITDKLSQRFVQSRTAVDDALDSLTGTYRTPAIGNALKQLAERETRISTPGAVSKDAELVNSLLKKHKASGLTMSEINQVKRLFERNIKTEYLKDPTRTAESVATATNLDSAIRKWQVDMASQLGFKNIKELNRETMLAKQLLDDLGAEHSGKLGNNAITLTDWIILAGGDPTAIAGFITKKTLSSEKVMSKIAEKMAPEPTVGAPKAQLEAPTIDNYLKFLEKTGAIGSKEQGV